MRIESSVTYGTDLATNRNTNDRIAHTHTHPLAALFIATQASDHPLPTRHSTCPQPSTSCPHIHTLDAAKARRRLSQRLPVRRRSLTRVRVDRAALHSSLCPMRCRRWSIAKRVRARPQLTIGASSG